MSTCLQFYCKNLCCIFHCLWMHVEQGYSSCYFALCYKKGGCYRRGCSPAVGMGPEAPFAFQNTIHVYTSKSV